jgi:hypothetical protein
MKSLIILATILCCNISLGGGFTTLSFSDSIEVNKLLDQQFREFINVDPEAYKECSPKLIGHSFQVAKASEATGIESAPNEFVLSTETRFRCTNSRKEFEAESCIIGPNKEGKIELLYCDF